MNRQDRVASSFFNTNRNTHNTYQRGGFQKDLTRLGRVSHNHPCSLQGPGVVQVLECWQIAANHLLSRTNDTLQLFSGLWQ